MKAQKMIIALSFLLSFVSMAESAKNVLLFTVDDMNWDSVGAFGAEMKGLTPNIDALAAQSVKFDNAHVAIAVCQPCRNTLNSGRYPHNNVKGFWKMPTNQYPTLPHILKENNYSVGILGKYGHSTPYEGFKWHMAYDIKELGYGRSPEIYANYSKEFIEKAKAEGKSFYLMANAHDPHRPFHSKGNQDKHKYPDPSIIYKDDEIVVPEFLPNLPNIRKEMAQYYSSVRRADDVIGAVMKVLEETGTAKDTVVVFLSDNGIAVPFAKTNCYLNSTKTPLIFKWPGVTKPSWDKRHFVSTIDFMPTILEGLGLKIPDTVDGRSYLDILKGKELDGWDRVYTSFHETSARRAFPMRAVVTERFSYVFSPWSTNNRVFKNESQFGYTWRAMVEEAKTNPEVAARVKLFSNRTVEEFFDYKKDPNALKNLIDSPEHQGVIKELREDLYQWMKETGDNAASAFENRDNPEALQKWLEQYEADAKARVKAQREAKKKAKKNAKK